ncbi:MAG: hypothetical protein AB7F20_04440 [Geoalkalibacter sp.]|uniref:hypothetical protein n=1 Tax=Geoalkalibacter sp. TaxID=3041440 RepID=UPI003D10C44A
MPENNTGPGTTNVDPRLERRIEKVERDLDIMDRHSLEMSETEEGIQSYMRRLDREYKDSHLHSVPKARKHS